MALSSRTVKALVGHAARVTSPSASHTKFINDRHKTHGTIWTIQANELSVRHLTAPGLC